jgi:hypothetical protein
VDFFFRESQCERFGKKMGRLSGKEASPSNREEVHLPSEEEKSEPRSHTRQKLYKDPSRIPNPISFDSANITNAMRRYLVKVLYRPPAGRLQDLVCRMRDGGAQEPKERTALECMPHNDDGRCLARQTVTLP